MSILENLSILDLTLPGVKGLKRTLVVFNSFTLNTFFIPRLNKTKLRAGEVRNILRVHATQGHISLRAVPPIPILVGEQQTMQNIHSQNTTSFENRTCVAEATCICTNPDNYCILFMRVEGSHHPLLYCISRTIIYNTN